MTNAGCTKTGQFQLSFGEFVQQCTTSNDTARALNFIDFQGLKELFEKERAQADSLLRSLQNLRTLKNTKGIRIEDVASKNKSVDQQIAEANEAIKDLISQTDAANEQFMETVVDAPKKTSSVANYQDLAIGAFFGSFLLLTVIFIVIQYLRPDGGLRTAVGTFLGMVVLGVLSFALLREIG